MQSVPPAAAWARPILCRAVSQRDPQNRLPRGAAIVVAVGLLACLAAALLSNEDLLGAAQLEWTQDQEMPDSKPTEVPGGGGEMRLTSGQLRVTEPNFAGYKLYRVSQVLEIEAGTEIGKGRIKCTTTVPKNVIVAKTTERRAAFPLSTSDEAKLQKQEVKENLLLEFNARGSELSLLEYEDAFDAYTNIDGVKVEWPPFHPGREEWVWFLPSGQPDETVKLGFASIWRTRKAPAAGNSCTLVTGAGTATVKSGAAVSG
jgi:hypothetical protein